MTTSFAPAPGEWIEDAFGITVRYLRTTADGRFVVDDGEYGEGEYTVPAADYGPEGSFAVDLP